MIAYVFLMIIGFSGGALVAAGVCALITSTGIVTRMADQSHTAAFIRTYETIITLGAVFWNLFWIYSIPIRMSLTVAVLIGLFQGVFVGCLAVSLAEALDGIAIFSRRVKLYQGGGMIILFTALGKSIFAVVQFLFL